MIMIMIMIMIIMMRNNKSPIQTQPPISSLDTDPLAKHLFLREHPNHGRELLLYIIEPIISQSHNVKIPSRNDGLEGLHAPSPGARDRDERLDILLFPRLRLYNICHRGSPMMRKIRHENTQNHIQTYR